MSKKDAKTLHIDQVKEKCILCNKSNHWALLLVKIPEYVSQCLDCVENNLDDKEYIWENEWWWIWRIGHGFI